MSASNAPTTVIDTTEGWTFAEQTPDDFPTTTKTDDGWVTPPPATTTDGWDAPVASPPRSARELPRNNDHASLHWTAYYDDYCSVHHQIKDNNYYPSRDNHRHRRSHR